MEYKALENQGYYNECKAVVGEQGYSLVELIVNSRPSQVQVRVVIAPSPNAGNTGIGVQDCAKVHRVLISHLEQLLHTSNLYIEVTSPGMERLIKNAAEFSLFVGRAVRLWLPRLGDWISGVLLSCDTTSLVLQQRGATEAETILYSEIAKAKLLYTEG